MSSHPLNSFSVLKRYIENYVLFYKVLNTNVFSLYFNIFLYQIGCNKMEDETVTEEEERYLHQLPKSCL